MLLYNTTRQLSLTCCPAVVLFLSVKNSVNIHWRSSEVNGDRLLAMERQETGRLDNIMLRWLEYCNVHERQDVWQSVMVQKDDAEKVQEYKILRFFIM